jgi:hypothetical protein
LHGALFVDAVGEALDRLALTHSARFTTEVVFRLCPEWGYRNVFKNDWFEYQLWGGELPVL